jgi:hypothetical protein
MTGTSTQPYATFARRLLLTPDQLKNGTMSNIIVVETGSPQGDNKDSVTLRVHAPGLSSAKLTGLRQVLCRKLRITLADLNRDWVAGVTLIDGEIIVEIVNPGFMKDDTVGLILGGVPAILQPLVISEGRPVYVLRGDQRLVIIDYIEDVRTSGCYLDLLLPNALKLNGEDTDLTALCEYVERAVWWCDAVQSIAMSNRDGQRLLSVYFKANHSHPDESEMRRLIAGILTAVASQATVEGPFTTPVLVPSSLYYAPPEDD